MKNYVECIKYPVRYECGYRAWQDVREVIVGPAQLIMPDCELNIAPKHSIGTIGAALSAIFAKLWF